MLELLKKFSDLDGLSPRHRHQGVPDEEEEGEDEPYSAKSFSDTFYLILELDFQLTIHLQCTLFCVFLAAKGAAREVQMCGVTNSVLAHMQMSSLFKHC